MPTHHLIAFNLILFDYSTWESHRRDKTGPLYSVFIKKFRSRGFFKELCVSFTFVPFLIEEGTGSCAELC